MTIKDRIFNFLKNHPEGIDDDDLARVLNLKSRQQANSRCRQLEEEGFVVRRQYQGKIHNFWKGKDIPLIEQKPVEIVNSESSNHTDWFWEGNVQGKVIHYLSMQGYMIVSSADTASHQTGIDIKAKKDNQELWVTVKGYPHGTPKTNPSVQAGHWFKQAIFDIIEYRDIGKTLNLALALPDFPRYHRLAERISWLKSAANYHYFWVDKLGNVLIE